MLPSELSKEVTETHVSHMELRKMTDGFKQVHSERQELLERWEDALHQMSKRDSEIQEKQEEYAMLSVN